MTKRGWNTLGACLIVGAIFIGLTSIANGMWLLAILVALAGVGCWHVAESD